MCVDWDWCHFCKKSKCLPEKNGNIYYCGHWDMHYGDGMVFVSCLIISLIFWDRFSACINTISSRTDPCQFMLSNKLALGLDSVLEQPQMRIHNISLWLQLHCTWWCLPRKTYKPEGKHRFFSNTHYWENSNNPFFEIEILRTKCYVSKVYFGQNAMLWWNTEKYRPWEISFDQQM